MFTMLEQILTQFQKKGWNLYEAKDRENLPQIVAKGPTEQMGYNQRYLVIPKIERSTDVLAVQYALNRMQITQKYPLLKDRNIALTLVSFFETQVLITERCDLYLSYEGFNKLLCSLTQSHILYEN